MRPPIKAMLVTLALLAPVAGCDDAPTNAVVENAYAPAGDAAASASTTVWKVWWGTTLFATPVEPGASSETERAIPGRDFAYALLAPGWSPADGARPPRLVAVKSAAPIAASEHDLLRIVVSSDTFVGDCASGAPLSDVDARFIVERIFPGDFAGATYDPATCTTVPSGLDAAPPTDASPSDGGESDADGGTTGD
jgi:hypothetical protein